VGQIVGFGCGIAGVNLFAAREEHRGARFQPAMTAFNPASKVARW
jgi:hypothetical protein